jgi:hypothetical protein
MSEEEKDADGTNSPATSGGVNMGGSGDAASNELAGGEGGGVVKGTGRNNEIIRKRVIVSKDYTHPDNIQIAYITGTASL